MGIEFGLYANILISLAVMPFLDFLFSPQAHKFRDGYNINHDTLMNVSPEARHKLIFYFIAEQVPQKLSQEDRASYNNEKLYSIGIPRTLVLFGSLLTPLVWGFSRGLIRFNKPAEIAVGTLLGGLFAPLAVGVFNRVYEGRFVESNRIIENLAKKYSFGIYDFSVAKKESHILQLMYTMDTPYGTLHS